jgi:hypothetical protein
VLVALLALAGVAALALAHAHAPTPGRTSRPATLDAQTVATPQPQSTPRVVFADPLTHPSSGWARTANCFFAADGYHIAGRVCYVPSGPYADATLSVTARQVRGPATAYYGLVLRRVDTGNEYGFDVDGTGQWTFYKCVAGTCLPVARQSASAIRTGAAASNRLTIRMSSTHFEFLVNGVDVGGLDDDSYRTGYIGLEAGPAGEVSFSQLSITTGG